MEQRSLGALPVRMKGKRVFVSAAGQGIGRASALACAAEGAHVVATDINEAALAELSAADGRIEAVSLDVRDAAAVAGFAAAQRPFDGIFNCAGVVHNGTILDCNEADWDFAFDLNVHAMMRVTRALLPGLLVQAELAGGAAILNMASVASSIKGFPNRFAYGASKAAVIGMTKSIAADFVNRKLRCNALCPRNRRHAIAARPDQLGRRSRAGRARFRRSPADGAPGHGRRHRADRGVSVVRRVALRHRTGDPCRWRHHDLAPRPGQ